MINEKRLKVILDDLIYHGIVDKHDDVFRVSDKFVGKFAKQMNDCDSLNEGLIIVLLEWFSILDESAIMDYGEVLQTMLKFDELSKELGMENMNNDK